MIRAIAGVIAGYVVMALIVMVGLAAAFVAMGAETAFRPESYAVTPVWVVTMFAVGIVAAIVGGLLCALIAKRGSKAPVALVILVIVLGVFSAVSSTMREDSGDRDPDIPWYEAAQDARQPIWAALAHPVVGAVGVLIGAKLRGGKKPNASD